MLSVPKSIARSVLKDHGDIFFEHELDYAEVEYEEFDKLFDQCIDKFDNYHDNLSARDSVY